MAKQTALGDFGDQKPMRSTEYPVDLKDYQLERPGELLITTNEVINCRSCGENVPVLF